MKNIFIALVFASLANTALAQDTASQNRPVKLTTATAQDQLLVRQFYGQVVAKQSVDLTFQVAGQIYKFPVIEGSTIPKGALIAQLDLEPFQLSLDQARLQKEQAARNLGRLTQLRGSTVSQVNVDDAQTQDSLADIAVRNAQNALNHATLNAPFDALIATRNVANFTTISTGSPIVRIHDMSELQIEIDVPELLFQRASANTNVRFTAQFPASDQLFPVELREFDAEASNVGQTFRLTLGMEKPAGLQILPGSSVTVRAQAETPGTAEIPVPTTALVAQSDGSVAVMVFAPTGADSGTVTLTPVTIKPSDDGHFVVMSGLESGSEIVATGVQKLTDGQNVRRFTGFTN